VRVPPEPPPTRRATRRPRVPRVALVIAVVVLLVLVFSLRGIARVATDYLWFKELGRTDVWRGLVAARFFPAIVAIAVTFAVMLISLIVAERLAPKFRPMSTEDEIVERYRLFVAPFAGRLRFGVSLLFAIAVGANAASQWEHWLLFRNAVDFGVKDEQFDRDIGFYVFTLPFVQFALGLLFAGLVVVFMVTLVSHYLNGGIRLQSPFQRVTPQVKAHLSVLLALMALVKTAQYWYARFDLVFSRRGPVDGAAYTDVKVQLPALRLLLVISLIAAVLFIVNIWQRGWALPIIAVGLWGFVSIVVGTIAPAATQQFSVKNSELSKETPYIARNITATRQAYGLEAFTVTSLESGSAITRDQVEAAGSTLDQVRVWDPMKLESQFNELQAFRSYYRFSDLDIDRYRFGDQYEPVVIATRELDPGGIPSTSWLNRHLIYTHGNSVVVAAADEANDGQASFRLSGIPARGEDVVRVESGQPGIYYGEGVGGYVVVRSREAEVEASSTREGEEAKVRYEGEGGVPVSGFFTKAALALRFWDKDLFLSSRVTGDSRVVWIRDVAERVEKAAPFLHVDGDPYPVIIDGEILWVVDAYTTTDRYPYSQAMSVSGAPGLGHEFNYVRNSVKAIVDAYDGSVTLYAWDEEDPILRAWRKAFPNLFTPKADVPAALAAHFRYPEELFRAQTEQLGDYHVTNPETLYRGSERWQVADSGTDVAAATAAGPTTTTAAAGNDGGRSTRLASSGRPAAPLYLMMTVPGADEPEFVLTRSYQPVRKPNQLQAFAVARSDPGHYGEFLVYEVDAAELPASPARAAAIIQSEQEINSTLTLICQKGSECSFGEVQVLPIDDAFLYVQPVYVKREGESSFLRLQGVAVSDGRKAALADDFDAALAAMLGEPPPDEPDPGGGDATVAELLADAQREFELADQAAASGDYAGQGEHLDAARELLDQAAALAATDGTGGDGATTTTTTPDGTTTSTSAGETTTTLAGA
jgi:hypothetical protein